MAWLRKARTVRCKGCWYCKIYFPVGFSECVLMAGSVGWSLRNGCSLGNGLETLALRSTKGRAYGSFERVLLLSVMVDMRVEGYDEVSSDEASMRCEK